MNFVTDVTSPREFPYWSNPVAVYVCGVPEDTVADGGVRAMWSNAAALMVKVAVAVREL